MLRNAIKLFMLLLIAAVASPAMAQDITSVRDINAIPQDQIDALMAGGENLMAGDITANIFNDLSGTDVNIVVVLMADPRNSGLGNVTDGRPSRVHVFGRDTSAVTLGNDGMGIHIVDGAWDTNNMLSFSRGDVVQIAGSVSPFGTTMQVSPSSITLLGSYSDLGLPDTILDPVVVTTDQVTMAVGSEDGVQANWANLASLRGQYVRVEGATLQVRDLFTNPDRPDFHISSDGGTTIMNFYDTGLQFRNDRGDYPDTFNNEDITMLDDFVPPPPGSVVNMQGFLVFQAFANSIGRSVPDDAILSIAPFERRGCDGTEGFGCDLEVTETPPIISDVQGPDVVPDGSEDVVIAFTVTPDPSRTISSAACTYFTSEDATEMTVDAAMNGEVWECTIPAQGDGVFTTYNTSSTDNTDATSTSDNAAYRTLVDGINSIEDIQLTIDGGPGDSPFSGLTTDMDISGVVTSTFDTSGLLAIQDNSDLDAWTGILIADDAVGAGLVPGDSIYITNATIEERFGVTRLTDLTSTMVTSAGGTFAYKEVTTDVLVDDAIAEAHESMLIQFNDVVITNNDAGFGEWAFSSDGTDDNALFADDASAGIGSDFASTTWAGGERLAFLRGIWWFSFGNYKLVPESPADAGDVTNVANESDDLPNRFALEQNFPNPFNPTTSITYAVPAAGHVTLEVFDLLGRQVKTLIDGSLSAGEFTVTFNASNLPSGLYLYRLTTGGKSVTKQMVLLK